MSYTSTSTSYWKQEKSTVCTKLTITKPVPVAIIVQQLPNLKALDFEFNRSVFKNKHKHLAYFQELLEATKLESLVISGSKSLEVFPACLLKQPLTEIHIKDCPLLTDLSDLGQIKTLRSISVEGATKLHLDGAFCLLSMLNSLRLVSKEIANLGGLYQLPALHHLELEALEVQSLPATFQALKHLKTLRLLKFPNLSTLPALKDIKNLESLYVYLCPNVTHIPDDFEHLRQLKKVLFNQLGTNQDQLGIPPSIGLNKQLESLSLSGIPAKELPDTFIANSALHTLELHSLPIQKLPKSIANLQQLEQLSLKSLPILEDLNGGIQQLKRLQNLNLSSLAQLKQLDFEFKDLPALRGLTLWYVEQLKKLPEFGAVNKKVHTIYLHNLPLIKELPVSLKHCESLRDLRINNLGISTIPAAWAKLKITLRFEIKYCKQLSCLPSYLHRFWRNGFEIIDTPLNDKTLPIETIRRSYWQHDFSDILAFWLFKSYQIEPVTIKIRQRTLDILSDDPKTTENELLLLRNLSQLNDNRIALKDLLLQGKEQVTILGKPRNKKTLLRKQMESFGWQYSSQLKDDTTLVLIASKASFDSHALLAHPRILFSEEEFAEFHKNSKPGLLQQPDTPKSYIDNIRQLLWTNEPANDLIALNLVKNNGLPDELALDFVIAAKVGKEQKTRAAIRKFLKENLSSAYLLVLNNRRVLNKDFFPYFDYIKMLSLLEVTQVIAMLYKRTGLYLDKFFDYAPLTSPFRRIMFQGAIDQLSVYPKAPSIPPNLTAVEIKKLLANPSFDVKITNLSIRSPHLIEIPESIYTYSELSHLRLYGEFTAPTIPTKLFKLSKIDYLVLGWPALTQLPEELGQLQELWELVIYAKQPISLPDSLQHLPKLRRVVVNSGVVDLEKWKVKAPHLRFSRSIR